jgi:threonine/homoserine/homoserine lactone efflux protein
MTVAAATSFAIVMFTFAIIPGPGVVAVVSCSVGRGLGAAIAMSVGMVCGDLIFLLIAAFGLSYIAHVLGPFFIAVRIVGASYLIWLGVRLWRANAASTLALTPVTNGSRGVLRNGLAGLAVGLGNPKVIAFYVGFLPTFLDLAHMTPGALLTVVGLVTTIGGAVMFTYAFLGSRAGRFVTNQRGLSLMNKGAGTLMIGAGIVVATK